MPELMRFICICLLNFPPLFSILFQLLVPMAAQKETSAKDPACAHLWGKRHIERTMNETPRVDLL